MQTFIVDSDFAQSMSYLDSKRLNKNLLEARQLLNIMARKSRGESNFPWSNHPAVGYFEGYEDFFMEYIYNNINECKNRGIKVSANVQAINKIYREYFNSPLGDSPTPCWYTDEIKREKIILTHRASLYKKNSEYYHQWKDISRWVDENRWVVCCPERHKKNGVWKNPCNYYWSIHEEAA